MTQMQQAASTLFWGVALATVQTVPGGSLAIVVDLGPIGATIILTLEVSDHEPNR